jgi:signal transduction histidine kinase
LLLSGEVGELNERQEHFLREAQKSCQRLNTFIGNLLEAARKASVVGPLEVTRASLEPTVRAALGLLRPLLLERELIAELRVDPAAPSPRFDPPRIEQVLINLLGNAVKYAPPGTRVEIAVRGGIFDGRPCAEVSVSDEGPGVNPIDRQRIFEPYVRTGEAAEEGGLGLGLALCKRIIEAHGGAIRVEPRPTGGSRFVFFLPAPEAG